MRKIVGIGRSVAGSFRGGGVRDAASLLALLGLVQLGVPPSAHAEGIVDVGAGLVFDNNVSNGQFGLDVKGDTAAWTSLSAGQLIEVGSGHTLSATGDFQGRIYDRFNGLNHVSLGLTVADRMKLGLGATAPWVRIHASLARLAFENDIRNGWAYQFGATAGKRFGDRWTLEVAYRFDRRTGPNTTPDDPELSGAVFDQKAHGIFIDGHYAFDGLTQVSVGYGWRRGDIVSTTQEYEGSIAVSKAIAADPVFGDEAYAYKLRATTQIAHIEASREITRHSSLNIGYQRQFTRASGDIAYFNNLFSATYRYRF